MTPSEKNQIGYSLIAAGNRFFVGTNPVTQEDFPTQFVQATPEEVDLAIELADQAFQELGLFSFERWLKFISSICDEIEASRTDLLYWFQAETGLPADRAEKELNRSILQFKQYARAIETGYAQEIKLDSKALPGTTASNQDLRKMNVPLGPVVVFGASNFPFAYSTLGGDVASAFAAGCPVIVKAHAMHPHTSSLSAMCIQKAAKTSSMPEGVFSHLNGIDYQIGEQLVTHPKVKAVGFTGSIQGGTTLVKLAQSRPEPIAVYAEMGSVNPIICLPDALEKRGTEIAALIAQSISLNAGQFCTSPGLIFVVNNSFSNEFIQELTRQLQQVGAQVMIHSGLKSNYLKNRAFFEQKTEVLYSGQAEGNAVLPCLVRTTGSAFMADSHFQEEVFGSFACIVECNSEEELKQAFGTLRGQLTATLHTESAVKFAEYQHLLISKAGRIILNGVPTGVEVALAQQHGGPFPSSASTQTAVGADAVKRFMRPVAFQNVPSGWLPTEIQDVNKTKKLRFVNEELTE